MYIPANLWRKEYEKLEWPKGIHEYVFQYEILSRHNDGSWRIECSADGTSMYVWDSFLEDHASKTLSSSTEIVDKEFWEELYKHEAGSDDEISVMSNEDPKRTKTLPQRSRPRGRVRKGPPKQSNDTDDEDSNDDSEEDDEEEDDLALNTCEFEFGRRCEIESHEFEPNHSGGNRGVRAFEGMEPLDIMLKLFAPALNRVVEYTNENIETSEATIVPLTLHELCIWLSMYVYMGIVKLPEMKDYWYTERDLGDLLQVPNFSYVMTLTRFKDIKEYMRFNDYDSVCDRDRAKDKAWKIRPILNLMTKAFNNIFDTPGKFLSADEAMVRITSKKFPCRRKMPMKPIDTGAKFYCLVDYATKICINLEMCDGTFTADNSNHLPWKCNGERILRLMSILTSKWHVCITDTYYTNVPLALEARRKHQYVMGMIRKDRVSCKELTTFFGTSKKNKPTDKYPKGTWVSASDKHNTLTIHGYMDSAVCFLLDPIYGNSGNGRGNIHRRNKTGAKDVIPGPEALNLYNRYMGGVDTWDQLRTGGHYCMESVGRNNKWTVTLFLGLFSMVVCNSYLIHRTLNPEGCDTHLSHTQFHAALHKALFHNTFGGGRPKTRHPTPGEGTPKCFVHHEIGLAKPGSRCDGSNRAKTGICHGCKGNSKTSYACKTCLIPLHPECHVQYHKNMTSLPKPNNDWVLALGL